MEEKNVINFEKRLSMNKQITSGVKIKRRPQFCSAHTIGTLERTCTENDKNRPRGDNTAVAEQAFSQLLDSLKNSFVSEDAVTCKNSETSNNSVDRSATLSYENVNVKRRTHVHTCEHSGVRPTYNQLCDSVEGCSPSFVNSNTSVASEEVSVAEINDDEMVLSEDEVEASCLNEDRENANPSDRSMKVSTICNFIFLIVICFQDIPLTMVYEKSNSIISVVIVNDTQ